MYDKEDREYYIKAIKRAGSDAERDLLLAEFEIKVRQDQIEIVKDVLFNKEMADGTD